jgi:uncharacterized membrane protein YesL
MRAFAIAGRALVSLYGDLFFLIGMSLLWWVTGGIFVAGAAALGLSLFVAGGPWWLAPVVAIPAGPATVALAAVCRRVVRTQPHDRLDYLDALKRDWKRGLALSAIAMIVLALILLNGVFYLFQENEVLRFFSIVWAYLAVFWLGMQLFVYPFFAALEEPGVLRSYKMAALATFANPLFAALLVLLALILTAVSVALPVLVLLIWPALMALMGEHGLRLLLQRAGLEKEDGASGT